MITNCVPLSMLPKGKKGKVSLMTTKGINRRRMLDLGLILGTEVEALQRSPSGDPTAFHIRGTVIALRSDESKNIMVEYI